MELGSGLFSDTALWWIGAAYGLILLKALRLAPWRRLRDSEQLHVFLGACLFLALLWSMRAEIQPGLSFHLLGVTALTLMFGWSFGIIGSSLILAGVTFNQSGAWEMLPLNALILGVVPATLTQVLLVLIRSLLPKNFFVYILGNAFLTSAFVGAVSGFIALGLLATGDAYSLKELSDTLLPFFPLMFLPEAVLNGWIMTAVIAFHPQWASSFSDDLYIKGK